MSRKFDVYALIWSGDWLPWLESTHLCHQFSELFSDLFMRMNSYDPVTALYYAWGCIAAEKSNLMKELLRCQFTSVHVTVTIFNITTRAARIREQFLRSKQNMSKWLFEKCRCFILSFTFVTFGFVSYLMKFAMILLYSCLLLCSCFETVCIL